MTYEFIIVGIRKMDLLKRANFEEEIVSQNVKKRLFIAPVCDTSPVNGFYIRR